MFLVWFITFLQVLGRYVLRTPIGNTLELISIAFLGLIFIGSICVHANPGEGHLGFDSIVVKTKGKLRFAFQMSKEVIVLAFFVVLLISGIAVVIGSWNSILPLSGISKGWKYIFTPIAGLGMMLFSLQVIINMIRNKTWLKGD